MGGAALNLFSPVNHAVKMESLQDVFSIEELREFGDKIDGSQTVFSVEPKIDGLSVSLEYSGGRFVRGSTRGDGTQAKMLQPICCRLTLYLKILILTVNSKFVARFICLKNLF